MNSSILRNTFRNIFILSAAALIFGFGPSPAFAQRGGGQAAEVAAARVAAVADFTVEAVEVDSTAVAAEDFAEEVRRAVAAEDSAEAARREEDLAVARERRVIAADRLPGLGASRAPGLAANLARGLDNRLGGLEAIRRGLAGAPIGPADRRASVGIAQMDLAADDRAASPARAARVSDRLMVSGTRLEIAELARHRIPLRAA